MHHWQLSLVTYTESMVKRTSPADARHIIDAVDLEELVGDKREDRRASGAKARRRQRRYKSVLTQHLLKRGVAALDDAHN